MLSLDTNILLPMVAVAHADHARALAFGATLHDRDDVAISEFVLLEFYNLVRNTTVMAVPLSTTQAVDVCMNLRQHPRWRILGFPPDSVSFHDAFWPRLREPSFARRRAYDWRTALALRYFGVTEFATANVKDFESFGFARVWNPLAPPR